MLFFLHIVGIEAFELPTHTAQVQALLVNCAMSFFFDFTFALAIFLTNPVVVSISSALVIPLSFIADYFLHGDAILIISLAGSVVVIFGLFVLNTEDSLGKLVHLCNRGRKSGNDRTGDNVTLVGAADVRSDEV